MTKKRKIESIAYQDGNSWKRMTFADDFVQIKERFEWYGDPAKLVKKVNTFLDAHTECELDKDVAEGDYDGPPTVSLWATGLRPATLDELEKRKLYYIRKENDRDIEKAKSIENARRILRAAGEL